MAVEKPGKPVTACLGGSRDLARQKTNALSARPHPASPAANAARCGGCRARKNRAPLSAAPIPIYERRRCGSRCVRGDGRAAPSGFRPGVCRRQPRRGGDRRQRAGQKNFRPDRPAGGDRWRRAGDRFQNQPAAATAPRRNSGKLSGADGDLCSTAAKNLSGQKNPRRAFMDTYSAPDGTGRRLAAMGAGDSGEGLTPIKAAPYHSILPSVKTGVILENRAIFDREVYPGSLTE